jgi:hypothetical protein
VFHRGADFVGIPALVDMNAFFFRAFDEQGALIHFPDNYRNWFRRWGCGLGLRREGMGLRNRMHYPGKSAVLQDKTTVHVNLL